MQYWYNYTGQPWKTQEVANRVRTQLYQDAPKYLDNNDDLGAESSNLVWSMLGFYPVYPGSPILTINGPGTSSTLNTDLVGIYGSPSVTISGLSVSNGSLQIAKIELYQDLPRLYMLVIVNRHSRNLT